MIFTKQQECFRRSCDVLDFALTLGDYDSWLKAALVWECRLDLKARAALSFAALKSLPEEVARQVASVVLPTATRPPIAPLFGYWDEAVFWSEFAEPKELEAYCLACFVAMPLDRKAAFLKHVQREQAA